MLAFQTEFFSRRNKLNIFLQENNTNLVIAHEKLAAFKTNILLWMSNIKIGNSVGFLPLKEEHISLCSQTFLLQYRCIFRSCSILLIGISVQVIWRTTIIGWGTPFFQLSVIRRPFERDDYGRSSRWCLKNSIRIEVIGKSSVTTIRVIPEQFYENS